MKKTTITRKYKDGELIEEVEETVEDNQPQMPTIPYIPKSPTIPNKEWWQSPWWGIYPPYYGGNGYGTTSSDSISINSRGLEKGGAE